MSSKTPTELRNKEETSTNSKTSDNFIEKQETETNEIETNALRSNISSSNCDRRFDTCTFETPKSTRSTETGQSDTEVDDNRTQEDCAQSNVLESSEMSPANTTESSDANYNQRKRRTTDDLDEATNKKIIKTDFNEHSPIKITSITAIDFSFNDDDQNYGVNDSNEFTSNNNAKKESNGNTVHDTLTADEDVQFLTEDVDFESSCRTNTETERASIFNAEDSTPIADANAELLDDTPVIDIASPTETLRRPEAKKFPKLYRLLRDGEDYKSGLTAKSPTSSRTVVDHVAYGSNNYASRYISTCATLSCVSKLQRLKSKSRRYRNGTKQIVEIDVNKLPDSVKIIDLTEESLRIKYERDTSSRFHRHARQFEEVLLEGEVPAECVSLYQS